MIHGSTQPLVKMSTRNIPGGKGAWGWRPHHLHVSNVMKIWEPKPPGSLWVTPGLLRDSFTFTFLNSAQEACKLPPTQPGHWMRLSTCQLAVAKLKIVSEHAKNTSSGIKVWRNSFLTSALDAGKWPAALPVCYTPVSLGRLDRCFSTAGPWHQLYRAARGSPVICHFSFLSIFHE